LDIFKTVPLLKSYCLTTSCTLASQISFKIYSFRYYFVSQVFDDLEVLAPPKEQGNFKLFLYSNDKPNQYGEILDSICDDYDF
jgi:hypothetical protein